MSSLTSLFDKRGKNQKSNNLTSLFSSDNKKFQQIKQQQVISHVVYIKPINQPKKDQPEDLNAAIFVGNIPLALKQKDLKQLFQEFGTINKVWFRSVPVEQNKLGKKANFILKKYQQGADSMNGYVKFQSKESAQAACKMNGHQIQNHTLRVFLCLEDNLDYETTIFVGNLPLDVKQQELRVHFKVIGKIINVRVIRDKQTFKGIGIGYVRFASKQQMFKAISTMNNSVLNGRNLRVKRAIEKAKLQKKFRKLQEKKTNRKGYTAPQAKNSFKQRRQEIGNSGNALQRSKENSRKFHFKRKMIKKP